ALLLGLHEPERLGGRTPLRILPAAGGRFRDHEILPRPVLPAPDGRAGGRTPRGPFPGDDGPNRPGPNAPAAARPVRDSGRPAPHRPLPLCLRLLPERALAARKGRLRFVAGPLGAGGAVM